MPYHGRKARTTEQKQTIPNPKGGTLTPQRQQALIALMYAGNSMQAAGRQLKRSPHSIDNTRRLFPEFDEQIMQAKATWIDAVERKLFERAIGRSVEKKEIWAVRRDSTGQPMTKEDGEPDLYLAKVEIRHHPPDTQALLIWLRSWMPEVYGEEAIEQEAATIPTDPDAMRADLLDRVRQLRATMPKTTKDTN